MKEKIMDIEKNELDEMKGIGVEIEIISDFLIIKELLTRMGIANKKTRVLTQSCHILHKKSRYYILSFLELFLLDGKQSTISSEDVSRRDSIIYLLQTWGLIKVKNDDIEKYKTNKFVYVLKKEELESGWVTKSKYQIGKKKFITNDSIVKVE
jgi:hypothetical protein